jgi:hypothetical protein
MSFHLESDDLQWYGPNSCQVDFVARGIGFQFHKIRGWMITGAIERVSFREVGELQQVE